MRRSSEATDGELRPELLDLLEARAVAGVDLGDLPLDVGGVLGEARLLDPGDLLARLRSVSPSSGTRVVSRPRREKDKREALLLGDGEEAQRARPCRSRAGRAPRTPTPRPARSPPPGTTQRAFFTDPQA